MCCYIANIPVLINCSAGIRQGFTYPILKKSLINLELNYLSTYSNTGQIVYLSTSAVSHVDTFVKLLNTITVKGS